MKFDPYPNLLSEEIADRSKHKNNFTNEELWYLTHSLLQASTVVHSKKRKVGNIKPSSVLIN